MTRLAELEDQAYKLAKRTFSLTSPEETCKVLYRELKLPFNGDVDAKVTYSKTKASCKKDILQKLTKVHDLPNVLLQWRKLNPSLTKVICPINRAAEHHPGLGMSRIYPECATFTATGRVSLHEPNIQNVPKDFEVVATPQLLVSCI